MRRIEIAITIALGLASAATAGAQTPLGTAFTYQGRLTDNGTPATGSYDLQFELFDASSVGNSVGGPLVLPSVAVSGGLFTVRLDFGPAPFAGSARWLQTGVRPGGTGGPFTILVPRQELTPSPNARFSATAPWAGVTGKPPGFADDVDNEGWGLTGNAGTIPGTNFIGTTDNQPLELRVNGARALRLEPGPTSPNIVSGSAGNFTTPGVFGAVIGGGGENLFPNRVTNVYGTVAGGVSNEAGGARATVGGGEGNTASGPYAAVGGGVFNTASVYGATVVGGDSNAASGARATVGGGYSSQAGGDISFAAGRRAKVRNATQSADVDGDEGTFLWADYQDADFMSTGPNQFLIRAAGGVGINTNAPAGNALAVSGKAAVTDNLGVGTTDPHARVHVTGGSVYIASPSSLIITSPNGSCWFITVSNAGALSSFGVACP